MSAFASMNNNKCPERSCRRPLQHQKQSSFDVWTCQVGHGAGVTIDAASSALQNDELRAIWDGAKQGRQSPCLSPYLDLPMARVDFVADDDTELDNQGLNARDASADVSADERFIWFPSNDLSNPLSMLKKAIGNLF